MRIQFPQRAVLYPASDRRNVDLSWSFLSVPPGSGTQPSALRKSTHKRGKSPSARDAGMSSEHCDYCRTKPT